MIDQCDMEGCLEKAVGWIEAQWTIADFVRYEACRVHAYEIAENLARRRVEGHSCWPEIGWYEDPVST